MKAYPDDLRKKVLTAYQEGKGSVRQLTVKSGISPTSVSGLIKNFGSGSLMTCFSSISDCHNPL